MRTEPSTRQARLIAPPGVPTMPVALNMSPTTTPTTEATYKL